MNAAARWHYYRRILPAYLGSGRSQLTFWHETPELNPRASIDSQANGRQPSDHRPNALEHARRLGPYYMSFREKADYAGAYDAAGIPMLDYRGAIGLQYNPIAIAQWGLANFNLFCETSNAIRLQKTLKSADWLTANLEQNPQGLLGLEPSLRLGVSRHAESAVVFRPRAGAGCFTSATRPCANRRRQISTGRRARVCCANQAHQPGRRFV